MLDIHFIRENADRVREAARAKRVTVDIDAILRLDTEARAIQTQIGEKNHQRNELAKQATDGKPSAEVIEAGKQMKEEVAELEARHAALLQELTPLLHAVPNVPTEDVPVGPDESGNVVVRTWGTPAAFPFQPKDHIELGESLGIIDTERAAKVTGARFAYLKGDGALLEFAIVQYVMQLLTSSEEMQKLAASVSPDVSPKPFVPVVPPVMIRPETFTRMARLSPEDKDERYYIPSDDLYLVGSAEHTLGSLHMDEILEEKEMPVRYIGFSTSFRREAGSYGKDTKGILRVHQFDKLEMESFTTPEHSRHEQDFIVAIQEKLLQGLELPYQVVAVCTGDMGKPDARQIDIETWIPTQGKYRETHTADLMTDYQTRRLNTKIRRADGSLVLAHTNDATAFAIGRILIAIIENYQTEAGTVRIPLALQPFMGGKKEIV
ncbi:MAG: serine--tRNA ligase [Patescibacteria group bacterium]